MQVIPGITRCKEHGLLIQLYTTSCPLCDYQGEITPELKEAFFTHEAHSKTNFIVKLIAKNCFDPRKHCSVCGKW